MKRYWESILVFLSAFAFFSIFQPWGAFRDPDAFYHAKMSSLLLEKGIIRDFPWLDLTSLGQHFADQHFLYHALNAPFVYFFGMFQGHQIASVIFGALFITVFFLILKWLQIKYAFIWTTLLLILPPVIARLNLGKASPLAMLFFFLGLAGFIKRSRVALFFVMALYVLTHGGWPMLFAIFVVYSIGEMIYEKYIVEKTWEDMWRDIRSIQLPLYGYAIFGAVAGVLMHPYRATLVGFLQTQIISIGVATPFDQVVLGIEWRPYELSNFLYDFSFLWVTAFILLYGYIFARREKIESYVMRWGIALGLCSAVLLAFTLKSRRFSEYMGPMFVLWFAVLGGAIDWKQMLREFQKTEKYLRVFLIILCVAAFSRGMWATYDFLHASPRRFDRFAPALEIADQYLQTGDRLFHSNWAQFPELFAHRDTYIYIAGLDPVFLLEASPGLSHEYTALITGSAQTDPYEVIRNTFGSSIALYEQRSDTDMIQRLKDDDRFEIIFENEDAALFRLR